MATLILRTVKGAPLTNVEIDGNFTAINTEVAAEAAATVAALATQGAVNESQGLTNSTLAAENASTDQALSGKLSALTLAENVTTTDYTFTAADNGKIKRFTNPAGCAASLDFGLPFGFHCVWIQVGGTITFSGTAETISSVSGQLFSAGENTSGGIIPNSGSTANRHMIVGAIGTLTTAAITDFEPAVLALTGDSAAVVSFTGTPIVGQTLTTVLPAGLTATGYQWTRNGVDISGATAASYTLVSADASTTVNCKVSGLVYRGANQTVPAVVATVPLLATLTDNFNDGTLDAAKWVVGYFKGTASAQTVAEVNERLEIAATTGSAGATVSGYTSANVYDLAASSAYIQLVAPSATSTAHETYFALHSSATNGVFWRINGTQLTAVAMDAGVDTVVGTALTYSQTAHVWLRIREAAGTIFFETAPNTASNPPISGDWVAQRSVATPAGMILNAVKASLNAGTNTSTGIAGLARFDGFNTTTSVATLAPATSVVALSDDFNDNVIDTAKWANAYWLGASSTLTTLAEVNGRIEINTPINALANEFRGLVSLNAFNFTGKDAFVRIGAVSVDGSMARQQFVVFANTTNAFYFENTGLTNKTRVRKLEAGVESTVSSTASVAFNQNIWVRIRESGGTWYFYTASNAAASPPAQSDWVQIGSAAGFAGLPVTSLKVAISAGSATTDAQARSYRFDGLNVGV
ncbi:hypothetical protein [Methylibium sp.]|uniref:hypothetical protein n=1 Tax=Methylibium sp. TaxID=2067992 RepID=UPI0017D04225|nr:hypothetical protein [Methylibium sp.]MBA3588202.1 hypothetical protein [Methylibium sp.]